MRTDDQPPARQDREVLLSPLPYVTETPNATQQSLPGKEQGPGALTTPSAFFSGTQRSSTAEFKPDFG